METLQRSGAGTDVGVKNCPLQPILDQERYKHWCSKVTLFFFRIRDFFFRNWGEE